MDSFIWYLETPQHWRLCEILSDVFGRVAVRTYDGEMVNNLRKRPIAGAWICEKG